MTGNLVADDLQVLAFPAMNTVSDELFLFAIGFDYIVFDDTVLAVLQVNAKEIVVEDITFNSNKTSVVNFNAARIIQSSITRIDDFETFHQDTISSYW